jgi:hypothetical protein
MHGITSNATSMDELAGWIAAAYPGIYIKVINFFFFFFFL